MSKKSELIVTSGDHVGAPPPVLFEPNILIRLQEGSMLAKHNK